MLLFAPIFELIFDSILGFSLGICANAMFYLDLLGFWLFLIRPNPVLMGTFRLRNLNRCYFNLLKSNPVSLRSTSRGSSEWKGVFLFTKSPFEWAGDTRCRAKRDRSTVIRAGSEQPWRMKGCEGAVRVVNGMSGAYNTLAHRASSEQYEEFKPGSDEHRRRRSRCEERTWREIKEEWRIWGTRGVPRRGTGISTREEGGSGETTKWLPPRFLRNPSRSGEEWARSDLRSKLQMEWRN